MNQSSDHVTAASGDCIADVPAYQLDWEAKRASVTADDEGEPVPDDAEVIG